jgi:putative MFS transporter
MAADPFADPVPPPGPLSGPPTGPLTDKNPAQLYTWLQAPVVAVALVAIASGFGQFGAVAALGDVAAAFGEARAAAGSAASVAEQAGLSGTVLGVGLAVIRLASLGALSLASMADRRGRTRVLLGCAALGLALVALGALSPGYWWFVAAFALSRPFLSATNALAQVVAGEHTDSTQRAKAVALVSAGYGLGAALVASLRGIAAGALGFRGTFALALVPLILLPVLRRWMAEPSRYQVASHTRSNGPIKAVFANLGPEGRRRLWAMIAVAFAAAFVTGPANSFVFVYSEGVLDVAPSTTAALFLAAVPTGLAGLAIGRWGADRWGRRPTAALALVGIGLAAVVTYSGGLAPTIAGSLLAVLAGYAFLPTLASLGNELFPTEVRATVAGWLVGVGVVGAVAGLVVFGAMADRLDGFAAAAVVVALPAVAASLAFTRLPETRGMELEESSALNV